MMSLQCKFQRFALQLQKDLCYQFYDTVENMKSLPEMNNNLQCKYRHIPFLSNAIRDV